MKLNYLRTENESSVQREAVGEKMSEQQLEEHKLKERLCIKNYQSKKLIKSTSSKNQETPYHSQQALGKAMKRIMHRLPSSPHMQLFVVEKLARSVGVPECSSSKRVFQHRVKKAEMWCIFSTGQMTYHGKHLEEKIVSSFMKQQRKERALRQLSKFAI